MNAFTPQVIPLHPESQSGMRYLALTMGNTARQTVAILDRMEDACGSLASLAEEQTGLSGAANQLHAEFSDVMDQIRHCMELMRELETE